MKSGTRSNGSTREPASASRSALRRRGTRGSRTSPPPRTKQSGKSGGKGLAAARHPRIANEPPHEDDAIGNERGEGPCVVAASGHDEQPHEERIRHQADRERDEKP